MLKTYLFTLISALVCTSVKDLSSSEQVKNAIRPAISNMQYGNEDFFSDLVTEACSKLLIVN